MNGIITIVFGVFSFIAVSNGRVISNAYPLYNTHRDLSMSCSCEDLGTLVAIVRALEEKECSSTAHPPNGSLCKAEELIMNLVNALVDLTTQALSRNFCHCPNQSGCNNNHPTNPGNGDNHNGGSGNSHSDGGLNLDLLNQNKKDNVLDLDLGKQHLVGVGLGGSGGSHSQTSNGMTGSSSKSSSKSSSTSSSKSSSEGLVNVDLLNPNKQNNIADVDLANQTVLGIGAGNRNDGAADK